MVIVGEGHISYIIILTLVPIFISESKEENPSMMEASFCLVSARPGACCWLVMVVELLLAKVVVVVALEQEGDEGQPVE